MARKIALIVIVIVAVGIAFFTLLRQKHVNVLLISIDTLRADRLGCYGYQKIQTPNIDLLAHEGLLFENAFSSVPLTLPSHSTMLTGLYPITHGIRDNGTFMLSDEFTTLAEVLKQHGYMTGAFIASFVLDSRYGLDQGFEFYDDDLSDGRQTSAFSFPERIADDVTGSVIDWIKRARKPFFAFVHYYDPHTPYEPPEPYASIYKGRPYDGEIAYTDRAIGDLIEFLRREDLYENTLIILVSDHGEGLGEHGEPAHGILLYMPTVRVPFIVRIPEALELRKQISPPERIEQGVRLVDIFPTVLDLLGIEYDGKIDGRSIVPFIKGESLAPEECYIETFYPYFAYRWSPLRAVQFNQWKYIYAPEEELYNTEEDPLEEHNLCEERKDIAEELRQMVLRFIDYDRRREKSQAQIKITAEEMRKLSALGYISATPTKIPTDIELSGKDPKHAIFGFAELMAKGEEAFDAGDFERARTNFSKLVKLDPTNPEARSRLARTLMELHQYEEAEKQYFEIIAIDSTSSRSYFHLGNIARMKGEYDRALKFYQKALELLPGTPEALANMGSVLLEKGLIDSAIVVLKQALKLDPRNEIALVDIGLGYVSLKDYDNALRFFHRVLGINSENVKALANISLIYTKKDEIDSTIKYLEKARSAKPHDPSILANLGTAYRKAGLVEKAEECYTQALESEPENVLSLFGLAAIRARQGRKEDSVSLLKRILEIDPDFQPAIKALKKLSGS